MFVERISTDFVLFSLSLSRKQFSYEAQSEENTGSSRSETADGTGKVFGQYAIKGADGISRIVSYTADSEGFR